MNLPPCVKGHYVVKRSNRIEALVYLESELQDRGPAKLGRRQLQDSESSDYAWIRNQGNDGSYRKVESGSLACYNDDYGRNVRIRDTHRPCSGSVDFMLRPGSQATTEDVWEELKEDFYLSGTSFQCKTQFSNPSEEINLTVAEGRVFPKYSGEERHYAQEFFRVLWHRGAPVSNPVTVKSGKSGNTLFLNLFEPNSGIWFFCKQPEPVEEKPPLTTRTADKETPTPENSGARKGGGTALTANATPSCWGWKTMIAGVGAAGCVVFVLWKFRRQVAGCCFRPSKTRLGDSSSSSYSSTEKSSSSPSETSRSRSTSSSSDSDERDKNRNEGRRGTAQNRNVSLDSDSFSSNSDEENNCPDLADIV